MNGETGDELANIIRAAAIKSRIAIGMSQNFFFWKIKLKMFEGIEGILLFPRCENFFIAYWAIYRVPLFKLCCPV
jgi:hypothetical protein